jgi:hypothetical protein
MVERDIAESTQYDLVIDTNDTLSALMVNAEKAVHTHTLS